MPIVCTTRRLNVMNKIINKIWHMMLAMSAAAFLVAASTQRLTPPPGPLNPPAGESAQSPKLACADLRSLTSYGFTVESATLIPASNDTSEYCRVKGQILPEIRFEVNLPASWNRRFYMSGNGGYAGESLDAPQRAAARAAAVRRGFASAATDTGHDAAVEPL